MNVASANTVTVNTSLFSAGDTLVIQNIGAGVTTVTAGTATVSSAGPLAIPQYGSGTLYFTSAGVAIFFPSAGPAVSSGLTFITSGTVTAQTTTDITGVFSSTYNNYLVIISDAVSSSSGNTFAYRYGTGSADTASTYINGVNNVYNSTTTSHFFNEMGTAASNTYGGGTIQIQSPNIALPTTSQVLNACIRASGTLLGSFSTGNMMKQTTTQYTSLHFVDIDGGTLTFKYKIYGYANS
jgi:hypothetical protein